MLTQHIPGAPSPAWHSRGRQPTQPQGTSSQSRKLLGPERPAWPTAGDGQGQQPCTCVLKGPTSHSHLSEGGLGQALFSQRLGGVSPLGTRAEGRKGGVLILPETSHFEEQHFGGSSPTLRGQAQHPAADGVTILWLWVAASRAPAFPVQGISQECSQPFRGPAQPPMGQWPLFRPVSGVSAHRAGDKSKRAGWLDQRPLPPT